MTERDDQQALFQWAALAANIDPRLHMLVAIPNGQYRPGQRLEPGTKRGFPDMVLFVPMHQWHGLAIELKYGKNKPTKAQDDWIIRLRVSGYRARVCYGFAEAVNAIEDYLEG